MPHFFARDFPKLPAVDVRRRQHRQPPGAVLEQTEMLVRHFDGARFAHRYEFGAERVRKFGERHGAFRVDKIRAVTRVDAGIGVILRHANKDEKRTVNDAMEDWQLDFEWLRVRHLIQERFGKEGLPDLNAILYLIGIQELGYLPETFTKEEKQDLMHIAVCTLLEPEGYYEFRGRDGDGWPHFEELRPVDVAVLKAQGELLKRCVVRYFGPMLEG